MTDPAYVALVTGGNRGIGLAISRGLAERGLHVVLGSRDGAAAEKEAAVLSANGLAASAHQLDVTDPASVARAVADTANWFGRLDVLVNNAGIAIDRGQRAGHPDFEKVRAPWKPTCLVRGDVAPPPSPRCANAGTGGS